MCITSNEHIFFFSSQITFQKIWKCQQSFAKKMALGRFLSKPLTKGLLPLGRGAKWMDSGSAASSVAFLRAYNCRCLGLWLGVPLPSNIHNKRSEGRGHQGLPSPVRALPTLLEVPLLLDLQHPAWSALCRPPMLCSSACALQPGSSYAKLVGGQAGVEGASASPTHVLHNDRDASHWSWEDGAP